MRTTDVVPILSDGQKIGRVKGLSTNIPSGAKPVERKVGGCCFQRRSIPGEWMRMPESESSARLPRDETMTDELTKQTKQLNQITVTMKKLLTIVSMVGLLTFGTVNLYAQDAADSTAAAQTEQTDALTPAEEAIADAVAGEDFGGQPMHQALKQKFIEGGVGWMSPILLCLVLGLAIVIERVIYLNLATVNTKKLLEKVEDALNKGGVEAAKDVCRNTRGPVASIFYQGLDRTSEGIDVVEKSVASYGSVQAGQLESGMSWISLFIALSPMLGFMGTVVGMIAAFDAIEAAGDIAPALVAGGMKIALLTTVAGLIAAVILQLFYNYLVAKIDSIVISMEDASISLVDILTKYLKK